LQQEDNILFSLLKKEVAATLLKSYPGMNPEISDWRGQDITDFQEDLLIKVNGQLSEKWFYTHMKMQSTSLPRIDVLNMLCKYAGYRNWDEFRYEKMGQSYPEEKHKLKSKLYILFPSLLLITLIIIFIIKLISLQNYQFAFFDADTGDLITSDNIRVDLMLDNESPVSYKSDAAGRIVIRTRQRKLTMIIKAPYYITDTLTRVVEKFRGLERIRLNPDSYALMINYFSKTDINSWQRRRDQLDRMISDDAMIYQIPGKNGAPGMELYNKQEFIDKLTMPSSSLKQIDVLDCRYSKGKIATLRFRIKTGKAGNK
jgi:hypothetical protein